MGTLGPQVRGLAFILILAIPSIALANMGLPMLAVAWPLSIPAFIPVVVLETWVVHRALNLNVHSAAIQMIKANLLSTLVGIPLAWIASVAIEMALTFLFISTNVSKSYPPHEVGEIGQVILSAPWLGPFDSGGHWIIPSAMMVLLVPFFFGSYWTEAWYLTRSKPRAERALIRRAVWNANLVSYLALLFACIGWLIFRINTHE
jgi:hypothetical protein